MQRSRIAIAVFSGLTSSVLLAGYAREEPAKPATPAATQAAAPSEAANRIDEHAPPLAAVREAVRDEWIREQRLQANDRFYADLRKRYEVTVQRPAERSGTSSLVAGIRQ